MPRTPHAMKVLIDQVAQHREDAETVLSDLDGLGVYRTVSFDEQTSEWLSPLVTVFLDPRIQESVIEDGVISVTFVPDIRADVRDPFLIEEVQAIVEEGDDDAGDAERGAREEELKATPVDELREQYGFAKEDKKAEIVKAILDSEFDV